MKITKRQLRKILQERDMKKHLELRKELHAVANKYIELGLSDDDVGGILRDVSDAYSTWVDLPSLDWD